MLPRKPMSRRLLRHPCIPPINRRCWFNASHQSAPSVGTSCRLSPFEALYPYLLRSRAVEEQTRDRSSSSKINPTMQGSTRAFSFAVNRLVTKTNWFTLSLFTRLIKTQCRAYQARWWNFVYLITTAAVPNELTLEMKRYATRSTQVSCMLPNPSSLKYSSGALD